MLSWQLVTKANALYRDGSKLTQPLSGDSSRCGAEVRTTRPRSAPAGRQAGSDRAERSPSASSSRVQRSWPSAPKLPDRRKGYTQKAAVGSHKVYIRTGEYEDGTLGEIFIDMHKEGAAFRA